MRHLQKIVEDAELVKQLKRGGVHGIAPEVAKKILVLLEYGYFHARTRQQIAQHDAGGAAADDATGSLDGLFCHDADFLAIYDGMFVSDESGRRLGEMAPYPQAPYQSLVILSAAAPPL